MGARKLLSMGLRNLILQDVNAFTTDSNKEIPIKKRMNESNENNLIFYEKHVFFLLGDLEAYKS